jgi:hypothetical protein
MRTRDSQDLASEALKRAKNFNDNLSEKIEVAGLTLNSKLPFKALSLREVLLHRFADQSFFGAHALAEKYPVTAATMTRACMETLARSYELAKCLEKILDQTGLNSLDTFLMNRLFGTRNSEGDWPEAPNILGAIDKMNKLDVNYREGYNRLSEFAHPNYSGGLGSFQRIDRESHTVFFGEPEIKETSLRMIGHYLVGAQCGFELVYNGLEKSIGRLNDALDDGTIQHE